MPLTAIANGRRVVSVLLTDDQWEEVKDLARREPDKVLYPGSDRQVFCRTSTRGLRHFVSRNGQGDTVPESAHHLMMKAHIARALDKAGWSVDVEVPFPEVGRIADVAATTPAGRRVVFEVQLSRQTRADFRARTDDYASCGAPAIWITPYVGRVPAGVSAIWTSVRVSDPSPTERTIASSIARLYRDGDLSSPKDRFDTLLNKVLQGQTWLSACDTVVGVEEVVCARCQQWVAWWWPTARSLPTSTGKTMFAPLVETHRDIAQARLLHSTLTQAHEKDLPWSPPVEPAMTVDQGKDVAVVCPHCQAHLGDQLQLRGNRYIERQHCPSLYVRLFVPPCKGRAWTISPNAYPSVALERPETSQSLLETPSIARVDLEATLDELAGTAWPDSLGELEVMAADAGALDRDYYPVLQKARNRFVPSLVSRAGTPSNRAPRGAVTAPRAGTEVFEALDKAVGTAVTAQGFRWVHPERKPGTHARFGEALIPQVGGLTIWVLDHTPPEGTLPAVTVSSHPILFVYVPDRAGQTVETRYVSAWGTYPPCYIRDFIE
ncbi:hypothetical protein A0K93_07010 [Corynebacterium sp. BCW_4722]|nr:hypothetical protein A0K93_07010 [Corynebacterium sp. BCW_4722]